MKKIITSPKAPAAVGPYSQAVDAGDLVFLSGQLGLVPETGELAEGGQAGPARQMLENVRAVLAEAGLDFSHVVKTLVFLTDLGNFAAFNAIYAEVFPSDPPARSCVEISALPKGGLVEMEVIARK